MKINRDELFRLYMEWVDQVSEECDWKTKFYPEEIVHAIAHILENNPSLVSGISKQNKNIELGLINYEGFCLKAIKYEQGISIVDQWDYEVEYFNVDEFKSFLNGESTIEDSNGNRWNMINHSYEAIPNEEAIMKFLSNFKL